MSLQPIRHMHDHRLVAQLVFEDALAIAERTCIGVERMDAQCCAVHIRARHNAGRLFHAVGTDILHGGGAHRPGDQRQILQTSPSLFHRPRHRIVPHLAGTELHVNVVGIFTHNAASHDLHLHHQPLHIAREQHVRAATEDGKGQGCCLGCLEYLQHIGNAVNAHQLLRRGGNAKGCQTGQCYVRFNGVHHPQLWEYIAAKLRRSGGWVVPLDSIMCMTCPDHEAAVIG